MSDYILIGSLLAAAAGFGTLAAYAFIQSRA